MNKSNQMRCKMMSYKIIRPGLLRLFRLYLWLVSFMAGRLNGFSCWIRLLFNLISIMAITISTLFRLLSIFRSWRSEGGGRAEPMIYTCFISQELLYKGGMNQKVITFYIHRSASLSCSFYVWKVLSTEKLVGMLSTNIANLPNSVSLFFFLVIISFIWFSMSQIDSKSSSLMASSLTIFNKEFSFKIVKYSYTNLPYLSRSALSPHLISIIVFSYSVVTKRHKLFNKNILSAISSSFVQSMSI